MAAIYRQRFKVTGSFSFPIDMLRYDECHPNNESDATMIETTIDRPSKPVTICLERLVVDEDTPPTVERWKSFDWEVVPNSLTVEEIQI